MIAPLPASSLYSACDLQRLQFDSTADIEPLSEFIGQQRALKAIEFAVGMPHEGFNLYVMGATGLGRHTLVRDALRKQSQNSATPADWCYVANFQNPHSPRVLSLPAGTARKLRRDMAQLMDDLQDAVPAVFQGDEYRRRAKQIDEDSEARGASKDELKESIGLLPKWQRRRRRRLRELERQTLELIASQYINRLERRYRASAEVLAYLALVKQDIIDNGEQFRRADQGDAKVILSKDPAFSRYRVNILVDNGDTIGAPIVFEDNPSYQNLLGRVEHITRMGTLLTDFTLIKAGALHRANGGFLVLDAEKFLDDPHAWKGLKRTLKARAARIEPLQPRFSPLSTISLEPEPVPIDIKVVLIGSRMLFYQLQTCDPEFAMLFKVIADFAEELPRQADNELLYARLIATVQRHEGVRDISRDGVSRIIEHSARLAWSGEKLSLNMSNLAQLIQEADYQAGRDQSALIGSTQVQHAIEAQVERASQLQEQLREQMLKDIVKIDTQGIQLAQVNGLSLVQLGDYAFAAPVRISATARLGSGELIDIERESEQGGPLHSKGVLILAAYLGERYAKHQPLSISASLVFEQSYDPVEGDSASAAELCALLSSLGDIPIKQSLAITGSISQHGQMQAIGGVCQKIEGYFDICKARGLTGDQGVIIPYANVADLMLQQELVQAVEDGHFSVYAVAHIEQAMELLVGLPAGLADADGIYPQGTINHRIQLRLAEWLTLRQHYAGQTKYEG